MYGSNKGKVKAGKTFASALQDNDSDMYYSSEEVRAEAVGFDASKSTFSGNFAWTPVLPGTVQISGTTTVGSKAVAFTLSDNEAGSFNIADAFTGKPIDGLTVTGTVDYSSGAYNAVVAGATFDKTITWTANYHYDQKSVGKGQIGDNTLEVPEVQVQIASIPIIAQSRKLKALYAFDSMFVLQKEYGSDINALLNTQVAAEIVHEIDGEIMNDLLRQAGLQNEGWSRKVPVGISKPDHYESFMNTLVVGSNKIFGATKRAQGTFLVAGLDVASVIETARQFKPASVPSGIVGPHVIGTIGQFTVIKNPYYPSTSYLIGYKGNNLFEAGYVYAPYMPVISTSLVMADDFVGRKGWATSYGKQTA